MYYRGDNGRKIRTSFKTLASNNATTWRLLKTDGSNKLVFKIMSSIDHMEWKIFIKANFSNNIHTSEKVFCSCYIQWFLRCFFSNKVEKTGFFFLFRQKIWFVWAYFIFSETRRPNKCCLWEVNLVFHM